jgi:uncharacterized NAD(P)/FAD-binding protein YdhS
LPPVRLVIVGAGPGGTGLLERLVANVPELLGDRPIEVVLIDEYPPGGGRIWRPDHSPHLLMNSMAEDVTMFGDDSVVCAGPIVPGPTLAEWAADHAGEPVTGRTFATRRVQSAYLSWTFDRVVASAPPSVQIRVRTGKVIAIDDGQPQIVRVVGHEPIAADVVVLALGHLGAYPTGADARLDRFAAEHGLVYLPPAYTADLDLHALRPGADVLVQGLGLAFVDLVALVTEGRGGRFVRDRDGVLEYLPSGAEPRLHAGSRRGVPYHSKTGYRLVGPRPPLPRFFTAETVDALLAAGRPAEFRRDVWPLIAKEVGWAYYHELFHGHPDRVRLSWIAFADRYAEAPWYSAERLALEAEAVPDPADRLDLERLDRPLATAEVPADVDEVQSRIREYVNADVERAADVRFSADLGAFLALLSVYGMLARLLAGGGLSASSLVRELDGWWHGFFSSLASGPPGFRLEQLLALSRAGLVRFLGPDVTVTPRTGGSPAFVATGPWLTDGGFAATALVDARLPAPSVTATTEPLLASLVARGQIVEELLPDGDGELPTGRVHTTGPGHVIGADGRAHPSRFAIGYFTSVRTGAAFARPNTNAIPFRRADATARAVLTALTVPSAVHAREETNAVH